MAATQVSLKGAVWLAMSEGVVLGSYKDSKGIWTLGVGHTDAAGAPLASTLGKKKLSLREVMILFMTVDLPRYTADVLRSVKVPLEQHELDALVHWHYNTGRIGNSNIRTALNKGDKALAGRLFMTWTADKELIPRRQTEQSVFQTGRYPSGGMVPVYPGALGGPTGKPKAMPAAELIAIVSGDAPAPAVEPVPQSPVVFQPPAAGDDPDDPVLPNPTAPVAPPVSNDEAYRERVKAVQRELLRVGLKPGLIDGLIGRNTIGAMAAFRSAFGLAGVADQIDAELEAKLKTTETNFFQPPPERAQATLEQAAAKSQTVEKVTFFAWVRRKISDVLALILGALGLDSQTDVFGFFSGRWSMITSYLGMVPGWVWVLLAAGLYIAYREWAKKTTEQVVVQAFASGDIIGGDKSAPPPPPAAKV